MDYSSVSIRGNLFEFRSRHLQLPEKKMLLDMRRTFRESQTLKKKEEGSEGTEIQEVSVRQICRPEVLLDLKTEMI